MKNLLFTYLLLVFFSALHAQQAVTNSGGLQLHSGATVSFFGNFTNNSTASLINNGALSVRGNISNSQASMNAGSGLLTLNGASAQTIDGTQVYNAYNLITNNNSGFTLNNNLSIAGVHTFTAGVITTSSTPNYLIYQAGATYSGSADSRHVNGWVRRSGSTAFEFPVGTGTYLRSFTVSNLSAASVFDARHHVTTTNTANVASPLYMVDPNEYWTLNQVSGGTAQVQLNWDNSKIPFPNWLLSSIRVAEYSSSLWTNRDGNATGDVTTTGSITSSTLTSFGPLTFGSLSATLPMNLLSITARKEEQYNLVEWTTEQELDVLYYGVERKDRDGLKFYQLGKVNANNSAGKSYYSLVDKIPFDGLVQYRIRSVDIDGAESYSNIITLTTRDQSKDMLVLNNPAHAKVQLQVPATLKGKYNYQLLSAAGHTLQSGVLEVTGAGIYSIYLKSSVQRGAYVLHISNGVYRLSSKLIIE